MAQNFLINAQHLLEKTAGGEFDVDITTFVAKKNKDPFKPNFPDSLIIHFTAGSSAESSASHLASDEVKASAHLVVDRAGKVYQVVPFNIKAWHAGKSHHNGRQSYNHLSIGIELDNAGELTPAGTTFVSWFKKRYSAEDTLKATHRNEDRPSHWHIYTEEQIRVCEEISRLLVARYDMKEILGHEEISPGRKTDPGPAFPLDKLRDDIFSTDRMTEDNPSQLPDKGAVDASKLNIRSQPHGGAEKVAKPLPRGKEVKILEERDDWYRVSIQVEGWVSKKFIKSK